MLATDKPHLVTEGFDHIINDPKGGTIGFQSIGTIDGQPCFNWLFEPGEYTPEVKEQGCWFYIEEGDGIFLRDGEKIKYHQGKPIKVSPFSPHGFIRVDKKTIAHEVRDV